MEFARRQLEKYGWTDGKGLGKHENGIAEALKPKLKRSVTGIGHDAASEFNEHWWETLYDKAANNIKVVDKNGKTKTVKQGDNEFLITNSMWHLKKTIKKDRQKSETNNNNEYQKIFVKKAILTSGGSKTKNIVNKSDSSDDDYHHHDNKKDEFKMTDEQLFAACGGRTAHKGARHGLKALGKLARIEKQEAKMLSMSKYAGYSHSKKNKTKLEEVNTFLDSEIRGKGKKKKRKYIDKKPVCIITETNYEMEMKNNEVKVNQIDNEGKETYNKNNVNQINTDNEDNETNDKNNIVHSKKKKRIKDITNNNLKISNDNSLADIQPVIIEIQGKSKKKKSKYIDKEPVCINNEVKVDQINEGKNYKNNIGHSKKKKWNKEY